MKRIFERKILFLFTISALLLLIFGNIKREGLSLNNLVKPVYADFCDRTPGHECTRDGGLRSGCGGSPCCSGNERRNNQGVVDGYCLPAAGGGGNGRNVCTAFNFDGNFITGEAHNPTSPNNCQHIKVVIEEEKTTGGVLDKIVYEMGKTARCGDDARANCTVTSPRGWAGWGYLTKYSCTITPTCQGFIGAFKMPVPQQLKDRSSHNIKVYANGDQWFCDQNAVSCGNATIQPKSCSVSVSGSTASFSGSNAPAGNNVKLWLARQDKAAIDPAPANQYVYTDSQFSYTGYLVDSCNVNAAGTCSKTYTVPNNLPAGDYYFHCDIQNDPGKCSGQPFCDYEKPQQPGGLSCTGYGSCSNNDNATYSAAAAPTNTPVPGQPTNTPTPVPPPPSCSAKPQGDADCNGEIDLVDYSLWLNHQCKPAAGQSCGDLRADFDADGDVDDDDLTIWKNNSE